MVMMHCFVGRTKAGIVMACLFASQFQLGAGLGSTFEQLLDAFQLAAFRFRYARDDEHHAQGAEHTVHQECAGGGDELKKINNFY